MPKNRTIEEVCEMAFPLPECPVKKQEAKARRVWLKAQIEHLLSQQQILQDAERSY